MSAFGPRHALKRCLRNKGRLSISFVEAVSVDAQGRSPEVSASTKLSMFKPAASYLGSCSVQHTIELEGACRSVLQDAFPNRSKAPRRELPTSASASDENPAASFECTLRRRLGTSRQPQRDLPARPDKQSTAPRLPESTPLPTAHTP
jgi:hypothetical protein